ncbi:hypothetical protein FRC01_004776 [Tulasnella sp. 417]|nr:hypothetical protein FRC01_004776 [Tulasnella sp. 417]
MPFPSSSIRSTSTESHSTAETAVHPGTQVALPPWARENLKNNFDLPFSLYPHLPAPTPSFPRAAPPAWSPSSSATSTSTYNDIIMTEPDDSEEDVDGTPLEPAYFGHFELPDSGASDCSGTLNNYDAADPEADPEPEDEDEMHDAIQPTRALSAKEKKKAIKAAAAIKKRTSPKRTAKAAQSSKSTTSSSTTSATGGKKSKASTRNADAPARRTRSSLYISPVVLAIGWHEVEITPDEPYKSRKTWPQDDRKILQQALDLWWKKVYPSQDRKPTKYDLPKGKDDPIWHWLLNRCKEINSDFQRGRYGLMNVAIKIIVNGGRI